MIQQKTIKTTTYTHEQVVVPSFNVKQNRVLR